MKTLIAYYSRKGNNYTSAGIVNLKVGNTAVAAGYIEAVTGGDLFEIETVKEYPADYDACTKVATKELRENARPELSVSLPDISEYDTVFIGYPNWWGTAPMAVFTFLESCKLAGKTVLPFCTHEGSGLGQSEGDIRDACPGARVLRGLAIRGSSVSESKGAISSWVEGSRVK